MTRHTAPGVSHRRQMMAVTLLICALALALAACGGRGAARNTGVSGASYSTSQQTQGAANGADNTDLQSADQEIQSALQGLESVQNDANMNDSSQDTEAQP